jgi:hypothetical protein
MALSDGFHKYNYFLGEEGVHHLDEQIVRLKTLSKIVNIDDLLTLRNMQTVLEILQIIEIMDVPIKMDEGYS